MKRARSAPRNLLLAAAILLLASMPAGLAGATTDTEPAARLSAKDRLQRLERKLDRLQRQVERVSKQPGPQGPRGPQGPAGPATGPASGDLTGTYPNPLIGPDTVGGEEVAPESLSGDDIANGTVEATELGTFSVNNAKLADNAVTASVIAADSVGSSELKGVTTVTSPGSIPLGGVAINRSVTCPPGQMVIGGGYAWRDDEPNEIIFSRPSATDPNQTWVVRGMELGPGDNALYAWANCLLV